MNHKEYYPEVRKKRKYVKKVKPESPALKLTPFETKILNAIRKARAERDVCFEADLIVAIDGCV